MCLKLETKFRLPTLLEGQLFLLPLKAVCPRFCPPPKGRRVIWYDCRYVPGVIQRIGRGAIQLRWGAIQPGQFGYPNLSTGGGPEPEKSMVVFSESAAAIRIDGARRTLLRF